MMKKINFKLSLLKLLSVYLTTILITFTIANLAIAQTTDSKGKKNNMTMGMGKNDQKGKMEDYKNGKEGAMFQFKKLFRDLNLTSEQKTQINKIQQNSKNNAMDANQDKMNAAIVELVNKPNLQASDIDQFIDSMSSNKMGMKQPMLNMLNDIYNILTVEQKKQFKTKVNLLKKDNSVWEKSEKDDEFLTGITKKLNLDPKQQAMLKTIKTKMSSMKSDSKMHTFSEFNNFVTDTSIDIAGLTKKSQEQSQTHIAELKKLTPDIAMFLNSLSAAQKDLLSKKLSKKMGKK